MKAHLLPLLLLTTLGACMTTEERNQEFRQKCSGYGFAPDTEGFAHCMIALDQNDRNRAVVQGQFAIQQGQRLMNGY